MESLKRLEEFHSNWDLSINIEKTKIRIVIFNKPTCSYQFYVAIQFPK